MKIVNAIVCGIVGVLLIVGIVVPIVTASQESFEQEYTTSATWFIDKVETFELSKDANATSYTIDGALYELDPVISAKVILTDSFSIYANNIPDGTDNALVLIDSTGFIAIPVISECYVESDGETATITIGTEVRTYQYKWAYQRMTNGSYGLTGLDTTPYLTTTDSVVSTDFSSGAYVTINNGKSEFNGVEGEITFTTSDVTKYPNLVKLTDVVSTNGTISYDPPFVFVPVKVTGMIQSGEIYSTLFGILPILLSIGLVVGVVGAIWYTKRG